MNVYAFTHQWHGQNHLAGLLIHYIQLCQCGSLYLEKNAYVFTKAKLALQSQEACEWTTISTPQSHMHKHYKVDKLYLWDRQTDTHENITYPHKREVIKWKT